MSLKDFLQLLPDFPNYTTLQFSHSSHMEGHCSKKTVFLHRP